MGFPRQEYWSGLPFPSPGDLPDPGNCRQGCRVGGIWELSVLSEQLPCKPKNVLKNKNKVYFYKAFPYIISVQLYSRVDMILLFEMKKNWYTDIHMKSVANYHLNIWSPDFSLWILSIALHSLSHVCSTGTTTSSHILLLPLIDAAKHQREPKTGSKEEGRVDRTEATDTVTGGRRHDSLAGLSTQHPFTNLKSEALGRTQRKRYHVPSDFPNRVFPKLQPLTSYLYKFCCACLSFMLYLLDIFFKETHTFI